MTALGERAGTTADPTGRGPRPGGTPEERTRPGPGRLERARERFAVQLWPSVGLFYALAAAATLSSSRGAYIGDNRFEQYWNPARRIAKTFTIWDGSRGLGRVREDFWPATTVPVAALRGLGFDAPVTEALFHALLIAAAGAGTVAVVRLLRPRIGVEHVIAGLFVAFGAYSATFLVPSNLYFNFALAPWLVVVVFRGVHSGRPWRWAAVFAVLVFLAGNADTPGLVYALTPVAALLAHLVLVERSVRWRDVLGWLARAGILTVATSAASLAKTVLAAQALGQRLSDTEAADVSAITSSWSESLRGLGNWLSYFPDGNALLKPQGEPYFTNWFVVVCTFVPPAVALFVLWQSRWRGRLLFALLAAVSALVLVGAFPLVAPSPLGGSLLRAYTEVKALTAFRNTYKVGAGVAIGVAVLFAYGVGLARRSLRRTNPGWQGLPVVAAFVVLAGVAFPFWTGRLYHPTQRTEGVPAYWGEAFTYLGEIPEGGRTLVLPQTSRAQYRWGWVGDDIFDALDSRDHAVMTGVPLSTPIAANLLEAVTVAASEPHYVPGTLAPMMRRLGLTEILLRNDLDWQFLGRPRPSAFDGLRRDPDLRLAGTFGAVGENTADPDDRSDLGDRDRTHPPIEIWALRDAVGPVATVADVAPLAVSGDGFGWVGLAQAGVLGGDRPVAFTADRDAAALTADLRRGSPLVVTDSNRRRLRVVLSYEADYSHTLAAGQQLDRSAQSLWRTDGSQSVAWYPDVTEIYATGPPRAVGGSVTWSRPAAAFDGDPSSSWSVRTIEGPVGRALGLRLRRPVQVGEARIVLPPDLPPGIARARLRFGDGSTVPVTITGRDTPVTFPARTTDRIELVIDELVPGIATAAVAELVVPGVDTTEYVQVPEDVIRRAGADPGLAAAVRGAPGGYVFERVVQPTTRVPPLPALVGVAVTDEETSIRRRFQTIGDRDAEVGGWLRLRPDTPDALIDRLIGGEHGAAASNRHNGALEGTGGLAVDGDPDTAWLGPARPGETLTLRFPRQEVRTVDLTSRIDGLSSTIEGFRVETTDPRDPTRTVVDPATGAGQLAASDPACEGAARPAPDCRRSGRITLQRPVVTDHLVVRITGVAGRPAAQGGRIRVDEVQLNGRANRPLAAPGARPPTCVPLGLRLDGPGGVGMGPLTLAMTVNATLDDLLAGRSAPVTGCAPLRLAEGTHLLDAGAHAPFDELHLLERDLVAALWAPPAALPPVATVTPRSSTELTVRLGDHRPGTILLVNQSYDPGWRARAGGVALGPARNLNGMNAWVLEGTGPVDVDVRYQPRSLFGWSLPVTAVALALCAYLVLRRPRAERPGMAPTPGRQVPRG